MCTPWGEDLWTIAGLAGVLLRPSHVMVGTVARSGPARTPQDDPPGPPPPTYTHKGTLSSPSGPPWTPWRSRGAVCGRGDGQQSMGMGSALSHGSVPCSPRTWAVVMALAPAFEGAMPRPPGVRRHSAAALRPCLKSGGGGGCGPGSVDGRWMRHLVRRVWQRHRPCPSSPMWHWQAMIPPSANHQGFVPTPPHPPWQDPPPKATDHRMTCPT